MSHLSTIFFQPLLLDEDSIQRIPKPGEMEMVTQWYRDHTESNITAEVKDLELKGINHLGTTILIQFWNKENLSEEDLDVIIQMLIDPDDDGNYPIYLDGEEYLVTGTFTDFHTN
jgi:hypothetical protein